MSKPNNVNKNHYVQAGRLTPDDMARERVKQAQVTRGPKNTESVTGKAPARPAAPASTRRRSGREE